MQRRDNSNQVTDKAKNPEGNFCLNSTLSNEEGNTFNNGPADEELVGLKLEERKRQRSEAHGLSDTAMSHNISHRNLLFSHLMGQIPTTQKWLSLRCKLASRNEMLRMELSRLRETSISS